MPQEQITKLDVWLLKNDVVLLGIKKEGVKDWVINPRKLIKDDKHFSLSSFLGQPKLVYINRELIDFQYETTHTGLCEAYWRSVFKQETGLELPPEKKIIT